MRVPFSWIKEYVDWRGTVEELAVLLTMSGTEVEAIDWVGAPREGDNLSRFVVGKVLTKEQHPNADKLSLCTVEVGEANGGVRQIVCGASNFAAGDTVAVSLSGAVLENGLKLRKASLRGVESDGMMMSEQELGFEETEPGHRGAAGRLDRRRAAARLPARQRGRAGAGAHQQPAGLLQHLRHRPRGRGGGPAHARAAAYRRAGGVRRRSGGAGHRRGGRGAGSVPALRGARGARPAGGRVAGLAEGAPHARRHAPHQQRGRCDQLRHARLGSAAARLRRRHRARRQAHHAPRPRRRADRHPGRRHPHP